MFSFFAPNLRKHDSNGGFCFVYKNKWIHQNHCFPNPHNDLHVVLKPTPNNKKRENRYVGIHITISFYIPNLGNCWGRTKIHYVGLHFFKKESVIFVILQRIQSHIMICRFGLTDSKVWGKKGNR